MVPGERIGVEEEAIPLSGAYVDKAGFIRSMFIGRVLMDNYKKTISVKQLFKRDLTLRQGLLIEGRVINASDEIALVKIYYAENNKVDAVGLLHASQVSSEYVRDIQEYIRPGDFIKARVLNSSVPYLLTTREASTGVIVAYCGDCGNPLYLNPSGKLICKNCSKQETRKLAVGYIYVLR
ncbi:MAG: exosome complex RNA-binding protein Csl4 [Desulfurococcaceae archaeon]